MKRKAAKVKAKTKELAGKLAKETEAAAKLQASDEYQPTAMKHAKYFKS